MRKTELKPIDAVAKDIASDAAGLGFDSWAGQIERYDAYGSLPLHKVSSRAELPWR